jgi:NADH:ubiquinone oxidoreductase subunit 5 (subunit L)/multisubunit Na+/H+ antiporter MnhA subunit
MGLGLGVTASAAGSTAVAGLCFGGALLHALNHSLFKGLLFMGAGAVMRAAGTGELEALGGLAKRMPRTALYFLAGAAAISGLPPFNGFISEFLIFLGSFGALRGTGAPALWSVAVLLALAAIGGLAGACFARAFGAVFLGEPRSSRGHAASDPGGPMLAGLALPAAACLLIGLFPVFAAGPVAAAVTSAFGAESGAAFLSAAGLPLSYVSLGALSLAALLALAAALRAFLLRGRVPAAGPTWDCGYAAPTARMQYGASSFAQPLTDFFRPLLRGGGLHAPPDGYFPRGAEFHTQAGAVFYNNFYAPAALMLRRAAYRFSWLQHGRLQFYILYIIAALLALLLWKL